jgi:hypothetical protein
MSTSDNYVKTNLIVVGLGLQIYTSKVLAGGSGIMSIHVAML